MRIRFGIAAALTTLGLATAARAQDNVNACYVPSVGAIYLTGLSGLPASCLSQSHVAVSWPKSAAMADASITTVKLADAAVVAAKLADGAVIPAKLADGSVGTSKIADGAITAAKLAMSVGAGSVTSVAAGDGLLGGPITGSGALSVNFATGTGAGSAITVARSDHTHARGSGNVAVGNGALLENTIGGQNTALGSNALRNNTTASGSVAVGAGTLDGAGANGPNNTAVGSFVMRNASGGGNTAVGAAAMTWITSGVGNVGVGLNALQNNTTGSFNIAIGHNSGTNTITGSENIYIGASGAPGGSESGAIRVGDADQTKAFIAGISGVTSSSGVAVFINASGQLGTSTSSIRAKQDVVDLGEASRRVLELRPVRFHYRPEYDDGSKLLQYGLIAEEVARVMPELAQYGSNGQIETVRYHLLPVLLLNEIQRQDALLKQQERRLQRLERELLALRASGR